jgi:hypothetical protein
MIDFEKKRPVKATVWMSIDKQNTGLLPMISAILGNIKAEMVHPMNKLDPINPTWVLDLQERSKCSYQLCNEVSFSHKTRWYTDDSLLQK